MALSPMTAKVNYDFDRDFTPMSILASTPFVITVNEKLPARTISGFVGEVKKKPGSYAYAASLANNTPQEVVNAIAKEVQAAVKAKAFSEGLIQTGLEAVGGTPEETVAPIAADKQNWLAIKGKGDLATARQ